jgi:hypothetical protein
MEKFHLCANHNDAGGILAADQNWETRMIEKQALHDTKAESAERTEPVQHVPVPRDGTGGPTDPEVIERLRSCH